MHKKHLLSIFAGLMIYIWIFPYSSMAGWSDPVAVLSENWGASDTEMGFKAEDTADSFPEGFWILGGKIVVRDQVNRKIKIYAIDGRLEKVVTWIKQPNGSYKIPEYPLAGIFIGYVDDNLYTYYSPQKYYVLYSPTGQLIRTSTTRPLELGKVKSNRMITSDGDVYKISVTYPDKVYQLASNREFMKYVRISDKVYGINPGGVWRFGQCGKVEGSLLMPVGQKETVSPPELGGKSVALPVQYGEPIAGPNGDVYTWKKSMLKYSIVKWTWVDDPSVPTGPDAPTGLTVIPSINGLYLTWTASAQDPGCVTGYEIARATSSGGVFSTVGTVDKGLVRYNDTTAETGTMYYYKVRAKAGTEYSPYTAEVSGKR